MKRIIDHKPVRVGREVVPEEAFAPRSTRHATNRITRILQTRPLAHRLFLLVAPFVFAAYALVTPPFETPDEQQHLFRAWQLSEFHLIGERRGNRAGGILPGGLADAAQPELGTIEPHAVVRPVIVRPFKSIVGRGTASNASSARFLNFAGSVVYSPAGYLPQIAAIWFGKAAGLSVENILRLGRLLNAALAILLIYVAVRVTPIGAIAIFFVGLLPMTASASAAFGQDGLAIGASCLLTALGLRVAMNGVATRREKLLAAVLTILLTMSKFLYLPIAMVAGAPSFAEKIPWRRLAPSLLTCLLAAALAGVWLNDVSRLVVSARANVPPAPVRLAVWLHNPFEFFELLHRTYITHGASLFTTLFTFGWLNVGPARTAMYLSVAAAALVLMAGDSSADRLSWGMRLWLLLIAASIVLVISAFLYLYWTQASADTIEGLQGRYFIPVTPLILIAFLRKRDSDLRYTELTGLLLIGANLSAVAAIATAYYG